MIESMAGFSFTEVTAFVSRVQAASERTVRRLWGDASTWLDRNRRLLVSGLLTEARTVEGDFRHRAERAVRDWEARRTRILGALEGRVARPVAAVRKRVNVASEDEVAALRDRIARVEKQLATLARPKAREEEPVHGQAAAASAGS